MSSCRCWMLGLVLAAGPLASAQVLVREPNSTLRFSEHGGAIGYATTNAFGTLGFTDPVAIVTPPGETNRLFVVEQRGRIYAITNLAAPDRTLFLDLSSRVAGGVPSDERGLLGMAFHPSHAQNRQFFLFYSVSTNSPMGNGLHQRLSRFLVSPSDPNQALPGSEVELIRQRDEANNHNGGDLHFGPDGYLYVSLGDEGNQNDSLNNSQRIDKDFFAGLLRIDVDGRPGNPPPNPHPAIVGSYWIPADNPFLNATEFNGQPVTASQVRTEWYAVGLRNPWRFSFDEDGRLFIGDVGGSLEEEINLVSKGGNYGWAYREGFSLGPKAAQAPAGFAPIAPIHSYGHGNGTNQGNSVTGGVVYRGASYPDLYSAYVFADYVSGNVWALLAGGSNAWTVRYLTRDFGIAGFGRDPRNGDILMADQSDDCIKRLVVQESAGTPPERLSETGAFQDLQQLTPHRGIVEYSLSGTYWTDGLEKRQWFSIPNPASWMQFQPEGPWAFPRGTVWIQHFDLELVRGVPQSRRRVETRFLVRNSSGVYGLSYRWDSSGTNATLVPPDGQEEVFPVMDQGMLRTQRWRFPGRQECLACHHAAGGYALGFRTSHLNREYTFPGGTANQIHALSDAGYFTRPPEPRFALRSLPQGGDTRWSREARVRAYLAANCAHCHQPGGGGYGHFDVRVETPLSKAGLVRGLLANDGGNAQNRVIAPGSLERSMLYQRITSTGPDRMPPRGTTRVDAEAAALIEAWILQDLPQHLAYQEWRLQQFGETEQPRSAESGDADGDQASNWHEYLTGTDPQDPASHWRFSVTPEGGAWRIRYDRVARRTFEVQFSTNLIDWRIVDHLDNGPFSSSGPETVEWVDFPGAQEMGFYRVRVREP